MNKIPFYKQIEKVQPKLHGLAVGMTLGISSMLLNQGCPLIGQCATCAACAPRLPIMVLPLLADGAIFFSTKLLKKRAKGREEPISIKGQELPAQGQEVSPESAS